MRRPNDIDISVENPQFTSIKISNELRQKGFQNKIVPSRSPNSFSVKILKNNAWETVADVHPIQQHYKDYKVVYGSTLPPEKIGKFNIQSIRDQQLRKGASVLKHGGAEPNRALKDEVDFINISRLMLDQKTLQAQAELERVKRARRDLEAIKKHTRTHKGWNSRDYNLEKDPIPVSRERQFIRFAVKNSSVDVRNITLRNNKVVSTSQKKKKKALLNNNMFDPQNDAYKFWRG
jgi:hypothetical protein